MQHNFTNEGGYNRKYRFLKNIMGLWMVQFCEKEIAEDLSFGTICEMASKCTIPSIVDANDDRFLAPEHMTAEVQKACGRKWPADTAGIAEVAAVIYNSLAVCYAKTLKELEEQTGCQYRKIHVVGGGQCRLSEPADSRKDRKNRAGGTDRGNCHRKSGGTDEHRKRMQQFERCETVFSIPSKSKQYEP